MTAKYAILFRHTSRRVVATLADTRRAKKAQTKLLRRVSPQVFFAKVFGQSIGDLWRWFLHEKIAALNECCLSTTESLKTFAKIYSCGHLCSNVLNG